MTHNIYMNRIGQGMVNLDCDCPAKFELFDNESHSSPIYRGVCVIPPARLFMVSNETAGEVYIGYDQSIKILQNENRTELAGFSLPYPIMDMHAWQPGVILVTTLLEVFMLASGHLKTVAICDK